MLYILWKIFNLLLTSTTIFLDTRFLDIFQAYPALGYRFFGFDRIVETESAYVTIITRVNKRVFLRTCTQLCTCALCQRNVRNFINKTNLFVFTGLWPSPFLGGRLNFVLCEAVWYKWECLSLQASWCNRSSLPLVFSFWSSPASGRGREDQRR